MGRQLQKLLLKWFLLASHKRYKGARNHLNAGHKTGFQTLLVDLTLTYSFVPPNSNVKNISMPWAAKAWTDIVHSAPRL